MKRIAVDLAKSVYQVAESVRSGQVMQRKRLNREAFRRYIQEQTEPVEWVMEACGTAHYWGRNRADDRCKSKALLTTCEESPYTVVRHALTDQRTFNSGFCFVGG